GTAHRLPAVHRRDPAELPNDLPCLVSSPNSLVDRAGAEAVRAEDCRRLRQPLRRAGRVALGRALPRGLPRPTLLLLFSGHSNPLADLQRATSSATSVRRSVS